MSTGIKTYDQLFLRHNRDKHAHKELFDYIFNNLDDLKYQIDDIREKVDQCIINEIYFRDQKTGDIYKLYTDFGKLQFVLEDNKLNCDIGKTAIYPNEMEYVTGFYDIDTGKVYKVIVKSGRIYVDNPSDYYPEEAAYTVTLKDLKTGKFYNLFMRKGWLYIEEDITKKRGLSYILVNDVESLERKGIYINDGRLYIDKISDLKPRTHYVRYNVFNANDNIYRLFFKNNEPFLKPYDPSDSDIVIASANLLDHATNKVKILTVSSNSSNEPELVLRDAPTNSTGHYGLIVSAENDEFRSFLLYVENNQIKMRPF